MLATATASAALTSGYYRIKSNAYSGRYIGENASHALITATDISTTDYSFLWYLEVSGSNVTIKNAVTQRYVQRLYNLSTQYTTSSEKTDYNFTLAASGSTYTFTDTSTQNSACGLHCASSASYNVVRWYTSNDANKWVVEAVTPDADELAAQQAAAQLSLTSGYYRIYSNQYEGKYITENQSSSTLTTLAKNNSYSQVWRLDINRDGEVSMKNVLSDNYVQVQNSTSAVYTTKSASAQLFMLGETKGSTNTYTFANPGSSDGLHCAATQSYNVVKWSCDADASVWRVEGAEVDDTALAAQKAALATATDEQLTTFFTTTACTELRNDYASMNDEDLRSAMSALPTTVQDMAVKVKNNTWTTYAGWDKTEKTFRVADYKAYSSGDRWTGIVGYSHHFGRLSNPTGIYADAGDLLQVYVGDIPDGETVKLEVAGYGQAAGATYPLHEGMNTMLIASSGNCFVFYEVDNTTNGAAPYTPIDNYAPVTVHIEGGTVQGCFDLTRGFTNTDFAAMKVNNLFSKETVCLKSTTHVFNLYRDLLVSALGAEMKVEEMMAFWSGTAKLEDDLCARSDFDSYCNNVYSVTGHAGSGNPNATTYGTNYFEAAYAGLFNIDQLRQSSGGLWTIAHEQGHNHQKLIQLIGTTEISNNMFSNAAIDWQGRYTSRTNTLQSSFDRWQQGLSWPERVASEGTWDCLSMYTQLYRYFHQAGFNNDFYPNLFRAFRQSPMTLRAGTPVPATEDYLKFYQTCCDVARLDLTEFFEVYSFFTLPPSKEPQTINGVNTGNYYVQIGDYSTYYIYVTQAMIDAAKAAVAAKGYPACNIMFIEDRVTAPLATYEGHAEGEVRRTYEGDAITAGTYGETGQYTDFDKPCSNYAFNVNEDGRVTMEGAGAVGFKLYDSEGQLVAVYNTTTFHLPAAAYTATGLASGYVLKAAAGNGSDAVATYDTSVAVETDEMPDTNRWYTFCSTLRGSKYVQCNGAGKGVTGNTSLMDDLTQWKFVSRHDGTYDIVSRYDDSYLNPDVANNTQMTTVADQPSAGWQLTPAATDGMYIIYSGTTQLNQTNLSGNLIYNWGGGSNISDTGCQYTIEAVDYVATPELSTTALPELNGWSISLGEAATTLETGQWYVMYDRGASHGYLFERRESNGFHNTSSAPSGSATEQCKYLVRLVDAGSGKYYIQTGYGNYFGNITASTMVPAVSTMNNPVTIGTINSTAGHFYVQSAAGVILDANDYNSGEAAATVVGWGTTVPTSTDGNNDWAFYPVTFVKTVTLNTVGEASYATFYFNKDMQTDGTTKAYYITSATDGYAQLTEVGNEGRDIPAYTAVVLINSEQAVSTTLTPAATSLESVVSGEENLLKGTLGGMELDLSDSSPNYSLGRLDDKIGFYKFKNGSSTTITLGANKAYLETPASGGEVKGFTFELDTATEVNERILPEAANSKCYDLSGRHVAKGRLHKGLYITGGRKVVVK